MTPTVFDRRALAEKRRAAIRTATPGADFLLDVAAEEIGDRLATLSRDFDTAVVIGGPTDTVVRAVEASGRARRVIRADLFARGPDGSHPADLVLDDEALPLGDASVDLVVSAMTLQWVNDLPGALLQVRRALRPDGLFLATFVGGDTLTELRQAFLVAESEMSAGATPRVAPLADLRDLGGLLQRAGFALPVTDQDRLTVRYPTPLHLMRELVAMGAGNVLVERARGLMPPALLAPGPRNHVAGVDVRVGAPREPAEAASAGVRQGSARRCARHAGAAAVAQGLTGDRLRTDQSGWDVSSPRYWVRVVAMSS